MVPRVFSGRLRFTRTILIAATAFWLGSNLAAAQAEDTIANAMSAGPAIIAQEAAILEYPEGWPGNWPNEPAEEFVALRPGSNGWTCIADIPDTPGNDPMCLNETMLGYLKARYALIDPPSTGLGVGYMLQGGGPVGSPPHLMVYTPGGKEDLKALSTDVNPITWASGWNMFPETPYTHLMIATPPQPEAVSVDEDKIGNAMSAAPAVISQEAAVLDYPEGWPGNWPNEPAPEYVELRAGSNGWTCIVDNPTTPGNDPMCLNETQLAMVTARNALTDPPTTGFGVGYMLQGGGPVGTPPHIMVYTPGGRQDLTALSTEVTPITWASGWNMYSETPYAHLMIAVPSVGE